MGGEKEIIRMPKRVFIARHGETVFNAARRVQGDSKHTPLTRKGFQQADAMGAAMAQYLKESWPLCTKAQLIASDTGRAQQTLAIVAEHIGLDWHKAQAHPHLGEIGMGNWGGRYYNSLDRQEDEIFCSKTGLFKIVPEGGESLNELADRLCVWIEDQCFETDLIVISHGITSRVLRALLLGQPPHPTVGVPVADSLPQGSMVVIHGRTEHVIQAGTGAEEIA